MYNWTDQCCKFSMPESIGECSLHFWQSNQYILYDYIPYLRLDVDIAIISKHGDLKKINFISIIMTIISCMLDIFSVKLVAISFYPVTSWKRLKSLALVVINKKYCKLTQSKQSKY